LSSEIETFLNHPQFLYSEDNNNFLMNDKDIDLEGQVKKYWKHWTEWNGKEVLPPAIENVSKEYSELYEKFTKENKNGNKKR